MTALTKPSATISNLNSRCSYDVNVLKSILHFVYYGLLPGHFATCVMLGDYFGAWGCAHSKLRRPDDRTPYAADGYNPISSMILWASYLPPQICGTEDSVKEWFSHQGAENAPVSKLVQVKMLWPDELYGKLIIPDSRIIKTHE